MRSRRRHPYSLKVAGFEGHPRGITYNSTHNPARNSARNAASHSKSNLEIRHHSSRITNRYDCFRMFLSQQDGKNRAIARLKFHSLQYTSRAGEDSDLVSPW